MKKVKWLANRNYTKLTKHFSKVHNPKRIHFLLTGKNGKTSSKSARKYILRKFRTRTSKEKQRFQNILTADRNLKASNLHYGSKGLLDNINDYLKGKGKLNLYMEELYKLAKTGRMKPKTFFKKHKIFLLKDRGHGKLKKADDNIIKFRKLADF